MQAALFTVPSKLNGSFSLSLCCAPVVPLPVGGVAVESTDHSRSRPLHSAQLQGKTPVTASLTHTHTCTHTHTHTLSLTLTPSCTLSLQNHTYSNTHRHEKTARGSREQWFERQQGHAVYVGLRDYDTTLDEWSCKCHRNAMYTCIMLLM